MAREADADPLSMEILYREYEQMLILVVESRSALGGAAFPLLDLQVLSRLA
jgi:hypothetical protein